MPSPRKSAPSLPPGAEDGKTKRRGKEAFVVVGLVLDFPCHLPQVTRRGLLGISLRRMKPVVQLDGVLEVQEDFNVSVPVMERVHRLKQHLIETQSRLLDA